MLTRALVLAALIFPLASGGIARAQTRPDYASGLSAAQTRAAYARLDAYRQDIVRLSAANRIQMRTLTRIALELGERNPNLPADRFLGLIRDAAGNARRLKESAAAVASTLAALPAGPIRTRAETVLARARMAFDDGRLADAEAAYAELTFLRSSDLEEARKAWSKTVDLQIQSAFVRGDIEEVDRISTLKSEQLARLEDPLRAERWSTEFQRATYWVTNAQPRGDVTGMRKGVGYYRDLVLPLAPRARAPREWALTQMNLGHALRVLGEWEGGTARLEESAAASRAALEILDRKSDVANWGLAQTNLGSALNLIGTRRNSVEALEAAVRASRLALSAYPRSTMPLAWASAQASLGDALSRLGSVARKPRLQLEAIVAYRLALEVRTRADAPYDWASTQNNLGTALLSAALDGGGRPLAEQGVVAFRSALEIYTRQNAPLLWSSIQTNLANALSSLGQDDGPGSSMSKLEEAIIAYRSSLLEATRDRVPVAWAQSTVGLANTLSIIGAELRDRRRLNEAEALLREARPVAQSAFPPLLGSIDRLLGAIVQEKRGLR